jgi:biopolymer transport protein ExbB
MTAAGLAVALPAVFAYNTFARANRVLLADLDAFAHDLHAYLTVGRPLTGHASRLHPHRAHVAVEGA